ncbi:MAG: LysR family transcriptional regulator [Verrucomicrobiota bacterium]|nr:LysR family transcriptional regulator [Verrucomicrobiota bacterium]
MSFLNYHHLRYFRAIANDGNLTRAAQRLNISQSALSIQLRKLEESLGQPLFERKNKSLILTEAGRITLDYAESIFLAGEELMDTLHHRDAGRRQILRIGSVTTLSRNFQIGLLAPFIDKPGTELIIRSGNLRELLIQLEAHTIDLILSNLPVHRDSNTRWHSHLIDEQPVSLVGRPGKSSKKFRFPDDLSTIPLNLPGPESNIRAAFDLLLSQEGIRPIIAAEVDDMGMLRVMARNSNALTLVPQIVVKDELTQGLLTEWYRFPQIKESFYAITPDRKFPNQLVKDLIAPQTKKFAQSKSSVKIK